MSDLSQRAEPESINYLKDYMTEIKIKFEDLVY